MVGFMDALPIYETFDIWFGWYLGKDMESMNFKYCHDIFVHLVILPHNLFTQHVYYTERCHSTF